MQTDFLAEEGFDQHEVIINKKYDLSLFIISMKYLSFFAGATIFIIMKRNEISIFVHANLQALIFITQEIPN